MPYAVLIALLLSLPLAAEAPNSGSVPQAAAATYPWSHTAPQETEQQFLLPDRVLHENKCDWRPVITPIAQELVKNCRTAGEAVLALAGGLQQATGVHYSTERRTHLMNALEALEEKKVSCTGQSILLVCALRAVGIPARAVGIATWNHVEGNHTWAEAWFDGAWHMIEYNEKDFNTPWVMESIGMIDPGKPAQHILAAAPQGRYLFLPAFIMDRIFLPAEDVTERYIETAREWYAAADLPADSRRVLVYVDIEHRSDTPRMVQIEDAAGNTVAAAPLPGKQDDIRNAARLTLPREGTYYLHIEGQERHPLPPCDTPVQVLTV